MADSNEIVCLSPLFENNECTIFILLTILELLYTKIVL